MKIVLYIRPDRFDMAELARRHPDHVFVRVDDARQAARELPDAEMLVTWTSAYDAAFAALLKEKAPRLRWIQMTTSGIDSILRAGGFPKGVIVTNSAGLSAPMIAEHGLAMALMLGHRLRDYDAAFARRAWQRDIKDDMISFFRKTLCIVGLGAVGQETARRAKGFGMRIIGVSRAYEADDLIDEVFPRAPQRRPGRGRCRRDGDHRHGGNHRHDRQGQPRCDQARRYPRQRGARRPDRRGCALRRLPRWAAERRGARRHQGRAPARRKPAVAPAQYRPYAAYLERRDRQLLGAARHYRRQSAPLRGGTAADAKFWWDRAGFPPRVPTTRNS